MSHEERPEGVKGTPVDSGSREDDSGKTEPSCGGDDGKFDLRQFVNSTSRWPLQEDVETPRDPPSYSSHGGDGGGEGDGVDHSLVLPAGERETIELCDLPAQIARSVWSGQIVRDTVAGLQALLLWMLQTAAFWTPRAVEFACRVTAVHLPVLCVGLRDWSTDSAPRLAARAWHALRVTAPHKLGQAYHTVATVWWPTILVWAHWTWSGLLVAVSVCWAWLQRLAAARSVFSHSLGLCVLGLHRCYNFLVGRFRARFPDAFEWLVGVAGACERRVVPAVSQARLRVRTAWEALLMALLAGVDKIKAFVTGRNQTQGDLTGVETGETTTSDSEASGWTTLEGVVLFAATCGRGVRSGRATAG